MLCAAQLLFAAWLLSAAQLGTARRDRAFRGLLQERRWTVGEQRRESVRCET
jgi:hypothetical protein